MGALIRKGTVDDIDGLARLIAQLFAIETDFKIDERKIRTGLRMLIGSDSSVAYVAVDGNEIVGMVTGQLIVSTAVGGYSILLEDMYIRKDHRRSGIGSMLITFLESWGKTRGCGRIQLVADKTNIGAHVFYAKNGFFESRMAGMYKLLG